MADLATLTIRNLEPELVETLKAISRRHGRSMEAEVRVMLAERVGRASSTGSSAAGAAAGADVRQSGWATVRPSGASWVDRLRSQLVADDALAGDDDLDAHLARLRRDGVDGGHRVPDLGAGS